MDSAHDRNLNPLQSHYEAQHRLAIQPQLQNLLGENYATLMPAPLRTVNYPILVATQIF